MSLVPLLLLLPSLSPSLGQECTHSRDCTSPYAPHCSRWGWCQWTSEYGTMGPQQDVRTSESQFCRVGADCPPRTPFCSESGLCVASQKLDRGRLGERQDTEGARNQQRQRDKEVRLRQREWDQDAEEEQRQSGVNSPRAGPVLPSNTFRLSRPTGWDSTTKEKDHRLLQESSGTQFGRKIHRSNDDRTPPRLKSTSGSQRSLLLMPTRGLDTTAKGRSESRVRSSEDRVKISKFENRPVTQTQTGHKKQNIRPVTSDIEPRELLLGVGFEDSASVAASERIDRQSTDYYDYYDYSYYTDFEVLKMGAEPSSTQGPNNSEGSKVRPKVREEGPQVRPIVNEKGPPVREKISRPPVSVKENPSPGESQGCLYDCVYDCVSISQLEAYRDCVSFCGKTCKDK